MNAIVVVTVYTATIGAPLYCDTGITDLLYSPNIDPWVAWPFDAAGGQCGDDIAIWIDGVRYDFKAWDSGDFARFCVRDGDVCHPIVADIPAHLAPFEGLSHRARVINLSQRWREWNERRGR